MIMTKRFYCCGNCPNYHDMGDGFNLNPEIENKMRIGQCRHAPPLVGQGWPKVFYIDYCGAHPSAPMNRTQHLLAQLASNAGNKWCAVTQQDQVAS